MDHHKEIEKDRIEKMREGMKQRPWSVDFNFKSTMGGKVTRQIKARENETIAVHCKVFAAWVNANLAKKGVKVSGATLAQDFSDGIKLVALIESLTGDDFPHKIHEHPELRAQKIDNVAQVLSYMKPYTNLSIEPVEIVDAHLKTSIALIWRLILNFQVMETGVDSGTGTALDRQHTAAQKLLVWLKHILKDFKDIQVEDFEDSFQDGRALCALVSAYDPKLLDYKKLDKSRMKDNLDLAFRLAEKHLGIPQLLEVDDMMNPDESLRPNEQCMMVYLSEFPRAFAQKATEDAAIAEKATDSYAAKGNDGAVEGEDEDDEVVELRRSVGRDLTRNFAALKQTVREDPRKAELALALREKEMLAMQKQQEEAKRRAAEESAIRATAAANQNAVAAVAQAQQAALEAQHAREALERQRQLEEQLRQMNEENTLLRKELVDVKSKCIGKVQIVVMAARGLVGTNFITGSADPYIVLGLEKQSSRTKTVKGTLEPNWNAVFTFYVTHKTSELTITLMDWERFSKDKMMATTNVPIQDIINAKEQDKEMWFSLKQPKKRLGAKADPMVRLRLTFSTNL